MAEKKVSELVGRLASRGLAAAEKSGVYMKAGRIRAKINSEEEGLRQLFRNLGEQVAARAGRGEKPLGEEEEQILKEIESRRAVIAELREQLASVNGMKICPKCAEMIRGDVAFCPKCGAPVSLASGKKKEV